MDKYKQGIFRILQIFIAVSGLLFSSQDSYSQCSSDSFLDKCASNLGTYNYIKSFVVNANPRRKSVAEYSYVFSKGSTYLMIACMEEEQEGKMVINLYDRNHELIGSTYKEKESKYFNDLQYLCSTTGVYYIKATFEDTKKGCGLCILGFTKD